MDSSRGALNFHKVSAQTDVWEARFEHLFHSQPLKYWTIPFPDFLKRLGMAMPSLLEGLEWQFLAFFPKQQLQKRVIASKKHTFQHT